jgi:hypothetical protein
LNGFTSGIPHDEPLGWGWALLSKAADENSFEIADKKINKSNNKNCSTMKICKFSV